MSSAHSPTFFASSPTSQLIFKLFRRFTYVAAHSPTLLSLLLRHSVFTYFIWRAAHGSNSAGVDGFFSERKNPEYDFLQKGSKAVGPVY